MNIGDFARLGHVSPRMLRNYDERGLLQPQRVDPVTGYRSYGFEQLARLHRIVALRDLGVSLEQIGTVLVDEPPLEQLRGMLRMRRAQIEQDLAEEQARFLRVEARLRALERSTEMQTHDVVLKPTQPLRIAEASARAPGFGHENIGPVFEELLPRVLRRIQESGARPGISVGWYEEPDDEGAIVVHAGFEIGDHTVRSDDSVRTVDLPVIEVASVIHRGAMSDIEPVYEALVQWIEDSGYHLAGRSRELYHEWHDPDSAENVTELQMPVAR